MASLRTNKLRQLGAVGLLGVYLLAEAWWYTSMSPDDTGDDAFIALLIGAPIAFALGWFLTPMVVERLMPRGSRNRRRRRSQHGSADDAPKPKA